MYIHISIYVCVYEKYLYTYMFYSCVYIFMYMCMYELMYLCIRWALQVEHASVNRFSPVTHLHSHMLPVLQDVFNPSPHLTPLVVSLHLLTRPCPPTLQPPEPAQREVSQCGALASGEGELWVLRAGQNAAAAGGHHQPAGQGLCHPAHHQLPAHAHFRQPGRPALEPPNGGRQQLQQRWEASWCFLLLLWWVSDLSSHCCIYFVKLIHQNLKLF